VKTLLFLVALLLAAPALAGTKLKHLSTPGATVQVPFKIKSNQNAGFAVQKETLPERRLYILKVTDDVRRAVETRTGKPVSVKAVYFAQSYAETADAAVVIFSTQGRDTACFFIYNADSGWRQFPSDFNEYKP